jgi:D-3-phosphoglycerate dehydrogenase
MGRTVLITDHSWPSTSIEAEVLAKVGARVVDAVDESEQHLAKLAHEADAILTCFATVSPAVIRASDRLQVVGRYGIGVDNIAVAEATRLGIPVTNVPGYCTDEVAEHVIALIFSLVRGVHLYDAAVRLGNWALGTVPTTTRRIAGCTLGIVGFGDIGRALAERARGLKLSVIVYDPGHESEVREWGAEAVTLKELAGRSDFVSLHAPLKDSTRALVDADFFQAMQPGAYLINAARGGLVDQDALLDALRSRRIAGAGIDVFVPERLPVGHPLLAQDSLLVTPHTAFYSEESVRDLARRAAESVATILSGRRPPSIVNPEVLRLPRWSHLV